METSELIRQLADKAAPVRRLPSPWRRAALWLGVALPYVALVIWAMSPRTDLMEQMASIRFQVEQAAALATAVLAAAAAFAMTVPGRDWRIGLLPAAPLTIWLASLGQGCLADWSRLGIAGLNIRADWDCLPPALLAGIVPAAAMVVMLRKGAPLAPFGTLLLGGLAVGALANVGLQFYHAGDVSIMVLVWHFGGVLLLSLASAWFGRFVMSWRHRTGFAQP